MTLQSLFACVNTRRSEVVFPWLIEEGLYPAVTAIGSGVAVHGGVLRFSFGIFKYLCKRAVRTLIPRFGIECLLLVTPDLPGLRNSCY